MKCRCFGLLAALIAIVVLLPVATAAAQGSTLNFCGAGEVFCRCKANIFTDLTKVTLAPGTREYVDARLLELAPELIENWKPGDVLFVGDSLTDIARLDFDPMLPRSSNIGVLGAKINDVAHELDLFEQFFASPSRVVVLAGTNNILSTQDNVPRFHPGEFQVLLDRLKAFKLRHGCEIFVRSIPPAESTPPAGFDPETYYSQYNSAVLAANAYLKQACFSPDYQFQFIDEYHFFWYTDANNIFRHNFVADRYRPVTGGSDYLHFGCNGIMISLAQVAAQIYPPLGWFIQPISQFDGPTMPPKSLNTFKPDTTFRYAQMTVPPGQTLTVSVFGSTYNYVSIFDPFVELSAPDFPYGYPSTETEQQGGGAATASVTNFLGTPLTFVVCLGTSAAQMGQYFSIITVNPPQQ